MSQLQEKGFIVTCDENQSVIADSNNEDKIQISLKIDSQQLNSGINFINVKNLEFKQIIVQNASIKQVETYILNILSGSIITIEQFIILDEQNEIQEQSFQNILQIKDVSQVNINDLSLSQLKQVKGEYINYRIMLTNITDTININQANFNSIKGSGDIDFIIDCQKNIVIGNFSLNQDNSTSQYYAQISAPNININQMNINIDSQDNKLMKKIKFQYYQNLKISTINIIKLIEYQGTLFSLCSLVGERDQLQIGQNTNANVLIDSIIVKEIYLSRPKQEINNIEQNILFDSSCGSKKYWNMQTLQIKSIEIQEFNVYNLNLMRVQNSNQIEIYKFRVLQSEKQNNQWLQMEMFTFNPPNLNNIIQKCSVFISNVELQDLNFQNNQNGLIYADSLDSFQLSDLKLISNQTITSFSGSLLTLSNILNTFITNINITLSSKCQFKSSYGGLFFLQNINATIIKGFSFNTQSHNNEAIVFQEGIQGGIFYIYSSMVTTVTLSQIDASKLISQSDGGFAFINSGLVVLEDVKISKFSSKQNGGAFFFDTFTKFSLKNVTISSCKAYFTGGAFFGGNLVFADNVQISNCWSLFGGGFFYTVDIEKYMNKIVFNNNKASVTGKDTCKAIDNLKISQFGEFNQYLGDSLKIKNYTFTYSDKSQQKITIPKLYNGMKYFVAFTFSVDGEWYNINPDIINDNLNDLTSQIIGNYGNIYNQISQSYPIPLTIDKLYFSFSYIQEGRQAPFQGTFTLFNISSDNNFPSFGISSEITTDCTSGMVQQTFKGSLYCQYCIDSIANQNQNSQISQKCLSCPKAYFEECYADLSNIKEGYWRQNQTVDSDKIFPCSIRRQNCIGGNYTGNDLCAEGHIGVECLECDLYNEKGDGSYSRTNIYSCTKCDNIAHNVIKIILLLIIVFIAILIIFKTNFRQQRNFVYKKYLSEMKLIYFGKSYYRLGQSGSYFRILSFYFQILNISSYFYGTYRWKEYFSFQQSFYNPVVNSEFSFDCFLIKQTSESSISIALKKISIITLSPFAIVIIALSPCLILLLLNKQTMKQFQYSASLVISYAFTTLFCIPVIDVLVSGMLCRTFNNGEKYSIVDFNMKCDDPQRLKFMFIFIVPFLFIYSIGIPGILLYFLVKNRNNLDKISCRFFLGFLYIDYKAQFFYWEYVRLSVKLMLIISLYSFLSSTQLIGFVSIAILIIYLIFLVKKQPYATNKLNNMEYKSVVIGCLYLIAFMINYSLEQQKLAQQQNNYDEYYIFSSVVIVLSNIISISFIAYMSYQIGISIIQPHLFRLQPYRFYQFITRYLKILKFKKYTERKRLNLAKLRKLVFSLLDNNQIDKHLSYFDIDNKQSVNYSKQSLIHSYEEENERLLNN